MTESLGCSGMGESEVLRGGFHRAEGWNSRRELFGLPAPTVAPGLHLEPDQPSSSNLIVIITKVPLPESSSGRSFKSPSPYHLRALGPPRVRLSVPSSQEAPYRQNRKIPGSLEGAM